MVTLTNQDLAMKAVTSEVFSLTKHMHCNSPTYIGDLYKKIIDLNICRMCGSSSWIQLNSLEVCVRK